MASNVSIDTEALGISWQLGETYRVAYDEGFVRQSTGLKLPIDGKESVTSFSTPNNPPQFSTTVPGNNTVASTGIQNVNFTMDRNLLTILGGDIRLYQDSGNLLVNTHVISNATASGNTFTFNVIGDLEANLTYRVEMDANVYVDRDGFKNNAVVSSDYIFTSPTAPILEDLDPDIGGRADKGFTNVNLNFDRLIYANEGNVYLYKANTDSLITTYPISSSIISGDYISLDIVGNIDADSKYYITSDANVVIDATEIKYPGITSANVVYFQSPILPQIVSTTPSGTADKEITTATITLDRTVTANEGNIYLVKANTDTTVLTYPITSNATISGANVSVSLQDSLDRDEDYYISADSGVVIDATELEFAGITANVFAFTAPNAPQLVTWDPNTVGNIGLVMYLLLLIEEFIPHQVMYILKKPTQE